MTREERVSLAAQLELSVSEEVGGAVVLTVPEAPESPMLNRVVGLGVEGPANEAIVDAALAAVPSGVTYYVAVAPGAEPADLPEWLAARGLEPGGGWMTFSRGVSAPTSAETSLGVAEVGGAADAQAFAHVVRRSYDLPKEVEPRFAGAAETRWRCWVAWEGDDPAGAAAMFVDERAAYLGFAGSLPEHRGKGAQSALLSTRIRAAGAAGCDLLVTETGEMRGDRPSNSYRNILRAGFGEAGVTANWRGSPQ
jgi:GNAT superfamily N-acetyltransferase